MHSSTEKSKLEFKINQIDQNEIHKNKNAMGEFNLNIQQRKSLVKKEPGSVKSALSNRIVFDPVNQIFLYKFSILYFLYIG